MPPGVLFSQQGSDRIDTFSANVRAKRTYAHSITRLHTPSIVQCDQKSTDNVTMIMMSRATFKSAIALSWSLQSVSNSQLNGRVKRRRKDSHLLDRTRRLILFSEFVTDGTLVRSRTESDDLPFSPLSSSTAIVNHSCVEDGPADIWFIGKVSRTLIDDHQRNKSPAVSCSRAAHL